MGIIFEILKNFYGEFMITIRKFEERDRQAVRKICMDTGKKSFQKSEKKRDFIGIVWIDYYMDFEPENIFVVDDDGQACGYVCCSTNRELFNQKMKEIYLPKVKKISFILWLFTKILVKTSYKYDAKYGGGFHINIDDAHQGLKLGPKLLTTMGVHLKGLGFKNMYLITANRKTRGYGFYRHFGFEEVGRCGGGSIALAYDLNKIEENVKKYLNKQNKSLVKGVEISKNTYHYLIDCLNDMKLYNLAEKIKESLYIDTAIVDLGFRKEPVYIIDIDVKEEVLDNIMSYIESLYKLDYEKYDDYLDVYNFILSIKNKN